MKKRFTEAQIIGIIRRVDQGEDAKDVARDVGVHTQTLYVWRRKYGGMDVNEAVRLRALEDENRKLKRLVADQALKISCLEDVNSKKW